MFLELGVPTFVEKPMTRSLADAEAMVSLARTKGARLHVGHIERYHPAYLLARDWLQRPRYIQAQRFSPFRYRSADIDVVLDLMIHDLDLVLAHAAEDPARVDAVGMSVLFAHADRASARLEFADGCVAELDASRVATGVVRKMQIFTADEILALNFGERTCRRLRPSEPLREARKSVAALEKPAEGDLKKIPQDLYAVETLATPAEEEPLHAELSAFVRAVQGKEPPLVDGEHALRVMRAAERIRQEIREHRWT
jgi:predicted dehydrogenase